MLTLLPVVTGTLSRSSSKHDQSAEQLARTLIRQGAPFNVLCGTALEAVGHAAPELPEYDMTLYAHNQTLWLNAQRTDFEHLDIDASLSMIHGAQPGAAAWLLNELHRTFGVTFPFTTPAWALGVLKGMNRTTPASRNKTYRQRHGVQVSVRESERLISREGYFTTYSVEYNFGKRLLPNRACDTGRARTVISERWPRVLEILDEANALALGVELGSQQWDVVIPAYLLTSRKDHQRDDEYTFTSELTDEMVQYYRNGIENLCVPLTSGRQTRRLYRCLSGHARLAEELASLLKGTLAFP